MMIRRILGHILGFFGRSSPRMQRTENQTETGGNVRNDRSVPMTPPMSPDTIRHLLQHHWDPNTDERIVMLTPRAYENEATIAVQATREWRVSVWDEIFLVYSYEYSNTRYYFGWNTPWDERHREAVDAEWYDDSRRGDTFTVKIVPKSPSLHWIDDALYGNMNEKVWYFGDR